MRKDIDIGDSYHYKMGDEYNRFLSSKELLDYQSGFEVDKDEVNSMLFDWQKVIVYWALIKGRAALFEDCGLGKTPQQLEWSKLVCKKTEKPVLILAPLAVSEQTKREGDKFGVGVKIVSDKSDIINGINITNYEKLHKFDPSIFSGVVLDESSILKNFSGVRRNEIIDAFGRTPYRLACTATPAPNDYMELGNHAEFLGIMTRVEMLSMFFINDTSDTGHWRLKGHVKDNIFWKWLSTWCVMISKPSDIGYEDGDFILPAIHYYEHIIETGLGIGKGLGLITPKAETLNERREVRRDTIELRGDEAVELIHKGDDRWVIWCNLNAEGDYLEKYIDGAVQVAGRHSDELKTERMIGFAIGDIRRIVTKPKIAGLGMNWQICSKGAFVGLSDSWEQFYQAVRRIWRFGQDKEVEIHIFLEEREENVLDNIKRKDRQAREMVEAMLIHMKDLMKSELEQTKKEFVDYIPMIEMRLPEWMNQK